MCQTGYPLWYYDALNTVWMQADYGLYSLMPTLRSAGRVLPVRPSTTGTMHCMLGYAASHAHTAHGFQSYFTMSGHMESGDEDERTA